MQPLNQNKLNGPNSNCAGEWRNKLAPTESLPPKSRGRQQPNVSILWPHTLAQWRVVCNERSCLSYFAGSPQPPPGPRRSAVQRGVLPLQDLQGGRGGEEGEQVCPRQGGPRFVLRVGAVSHGGGVSHGRQGGPRPNQIFLGWHPRPVSDTNAVGWATAGRGQTKNWKLVRPRPDAAQPSTQFHDCPSTTHQKKNGMDRKPVNSCCVHIDLTLSLSLTTLLLLTTNSD